MTETPIGQRNSSDNVWMARPARPPTTVPLMRMNWRSRPTCSSMRRPVSAASQRSTVEEISSATSPLVVLDDVEGEALDPPVDLGLQLVVDAEAAAGRGEAVDEAPAQVAVGVLGGVQQRRLDLAPQRLQPTLHVRVLEQLELHRLALGDQHRVLAQLHRQRLDPGVDAAPHLVIRRRRDVGEEALHAA